MPRMLKLVIFDLDGTLMDAYRAVWKSVNHALRKMGRPSLSHAAVKRAVGWGDAHLIRTCVGDQATEEILKIYRRHHTRALKKGVKLLPGALGVIRKFKAVGLKLAVASNRPSRFSRIAMRALNIRSYFDFVICADEVGRGKPHPDIFRAILKKFSVSAEQALYVGDMVIDVVAGRKSGLRTVAVLTGSSRRSELASGRPYRIIRSLKELPGIVAGLHRGRTTFVGKKY